MLTLDQNIIIYLMLLNGILFSGANIIAYIMVNPGPRGSKRKGYAFLIAAMLVLCVQQEYRALLQLGLSSASVGKALIGLTVPIFALHLAFYRFRKKGRASENQPPSQRK